MQKLEVSDSQAPSLPANNLVHPLVGKQVVVTYGPHRGYNGYIQAIGIPAIAVKLQALFTPFMSTLQKFAWHHLKLM